MAIDAWLPAAYALPGGDVTRRARSHGEDWQIYETRDGHALLATDALAARWASDGLIDLGKWSQLAIGGETFHVFGCLPMQCLAPLGDCPAPSSVRQVRRIADAFRESRALAPQAPLQDALYVEAIGRLLPIYAKTPTVADDIVFGRWLSGGVQVSVHAVRRLRTLTAWMGDHHLAESVARAGFVVDEAMVDLSDGATGLEDRVPKPTRVGSTATRPADAPAFTLVGRPALTQFLHEHVIDIVENSERYKALNIEFPSAIILHGPPGCGKTFAIDQLIDYLGWPAYQIDASSVASPYIHATSKKVAEVFNQAIKNAPSIVVMDEMESFVADREMGGKSSNYRIEEVAEFLRRIPEAISKRVLVIGLTNKIEMIDPAILRRGRFDHVVKVDMPSWEEVHVLLTELISVLPHADDIDLESAAEQLQGRPMSDVTFVVREAARQAARAGLDAINAALFAQALQATPSRTDEADGPSRKIGFT